MSSASPLVRQQQQQSQQQQSSDTTSRSPNNSPVSANGLVNGHGQGQGHAHGRAQDVMGDLRAKVEIERTMRREGWMRAALAKAAKSVFVYEGGVGDAEKGGKEREREPRATEVVVNLKQLTVKLQVCVHFPSFFSTCDVGDEV